MSRDNVIKALECCTHKPRADCDNCPMVEKRGCAIELYSKALEVIRQDFDVAMEIFAEIEKKINLALDINRKEKDELICKGFFSHALLCHLDCKINTLKGIADFVAELKKKYTESEKKNG